MLKSSLCGVCMHVCECVCVSPVNPQEVINAPSLSFWFSSLCALNRMTRFHSKPEQHHYPLCSSLYLCSVSRNTCLNTFAVTVCSSYSNIFFDCAKICRGWKHKTQLKIFIPGVVIAITSVTLNPKWKKHSVKLHRVTMITVASLVWQIICFYQ